MAGLETALRSSPLVAGCVVLSRTRTDGSTGLVAYVVSSSQLSPGRLESHLDGLGYAGERPDGYVPIAALPLTADGGLDRGALARLPVLDDETLNEIEIALSESNSGEVVAVAEGARDPRPGLHLSDLLVNVDGPSSAGAAVAPSAPAVRQQPGSGPRAEALGGPTPVTTVTTLPEVLERAAATHDGHGITYIRSDGSEDFQSYSTLLAEATEVARGLVGQGLPAGALLLFQIQGQRDFLTAFWGCQLAGLVPVPAGVGSAYGPAAVAGETLRRSWEALGHPAILTTEDLRPPLENPEPGRQARVLTLEKLTSAHAGHQVPERRDTDLALVMLTSGSTGAPKGVMLTHRNLIGQNAGLAQHQGLTAGDAIFNWTPLDHVGGVICCHLASVFVGCRQVQCPASHILEDPLRWIDLLARHRCSATYSPNFSFGLVNDRLAMTEPRQWDLSAMRAIWNGGEAVVPRTVLRFLHLLAPFGLRATTMMPAWGMSETSSGLTFSLGFSPETATEHDGSTGVGGPLPGTALRITDPAGTVVAEGVVGRLEVSGRSVTSGYFGNPEATREAFTSDGWFRTGDLGFVRDGELTITGREKDVIIINGVNHSSHEIESTVEQLGGVVPSYTAACAVREPGGDTDRLAIFLHAESRAPGDVRGLITTVRAETARRHGVTPDYVLPVEVADIPKTNIGKIQRTILSRRFQAGEFAEITKRTDRLEGNHRTLPDWFFRPVWRRVAIEAPVAGSPPAGATVVFQDQHGWGAAVSASLAAAGHRCIGVVAGSGFAIVGPDRFTIDAGNPEHYRRLAEAVTGAGLAIVRSAHLWTCSEPPSNPPGRGLARELEQGLFSLVHWIKAVVAIRREPNSIRVIVGSTHSQSATSGDRVLAERAAIVGAVKSARREYPWLDLRHVDLSPEDSDAVTHLVAELASASDEAELAYRGGHRLAARLERLELPAGGPSAAGFHQGGLYLISGGLGGIGKELGSRLLREFGARLLIVGRTPAARDGSSPGSPSLAALETAGPGRVRYAAVDVLDQSALRAAVDDARRHWQADLAGILHLAGSYHESPVGSETPESLTALVAARVQGGRSLASLLDRPEQIFVAASSGAAWFGGAGLTGYAAASRYLEGLVAELRATQPFRSVVIGWSVWRDIGMSRRFNNTALLETLGFRALSARQGWLSLQVALQFDLARCYIGLDSAHRQIRRYLADDDGRIQTARVFHSATTPVRIGDCRDRYGTPIEISVHPVRRLPRTETGAIDRDALTAGGERGQAANRAMPTTDLERQLAAMWEEVLGVDAVGRHDHFGALGGHSLIATQLVSRIRDQLQLEVPLVTIFTSPTIETLAVAISQLPRGGRPRPGPRKRQSSPRTVP